MTQIPISRTKITPPRRRPELLTRKRLLDALFNVLDSRLVLVSAPAGYGKTSLLIDAVPLSEFKCCWLSLDELDREPRRFIAYLTACIAEQFPGFGFQIAEVMKDIAAPDGDIERIAVSLVNEAYEHIQEHYVLVLDDFHILEGVQPIYDLMNRFVQLVDDNCHIVISSRTLTPITDLPLMVAREQVGGLSFADLAFQKEEIQALILQNNNIHISDDDARKLMEETEGWVTGLQFSGSNFTPLGSTKPITGMGAGLFDYMGQQVLDRQKPELREFLMRSSLLEEFDAALCEATLGVLYPSPQDWEGFISFILQNNLFAVPVGANGAFVRYHHLFRDYLQSRMKKERGGEVAPIYQRLGLAYQAMGEWEKAHFIIKTLKDANALADLIERAGFLNMDTFGRTIETWLGDLPPSIRRTRPGILSIIGMVKLTNGDARGAIEDFDRAIETFRGQAEIPQLALSLTRRAWGRRSLGDYSAAIQDADEAIELTKNRDDSQILFAEALRTKGNALYRAGRMYEILPCFELAFEILSRFNDNNVLMDLMTGIAAANQALGNFAEAEKYYLQVLKARRQEGNLWAQAALFNEIGYLYHRAGDYKKSAHAFEEGLLCARRIHHARSEMLTLISLGDLFTELQDFEIASQCFQNAEDAFRERDDQFLQFALLNGRAAMKFLQNDLESLKENIHTMEGMSITEDSQYEKGHFNLLYGKLSLLLGNADQAVRYMEGAIGYFESSGLLIELAAGRVWLAAAYALQGNSQQFRASILEMPGVNGKMDHTSLVAIAQSRRWLEAYQKDEQAGRQIRSLFTRAELFMEKLPALRRELRWQAQTLEVPAAHLIIKGFGRSSVKLAGREIGNSDWQTQSVRDLFFFLLSHSKPLSKEEIANILWPELDEPAKIRQRFKNDMYRLRRAVGADVIRFENSVYSFDRTIHYEYDVEIFESSLVRAKFAQTDEERIEYQRKAVDKVQGVYLQDNYLDWTTADRERLRQAYLSTLIALAEAYLKHAQLDESLLMCERALAEEATLESAYCVEMRVHHRRSDRVAIQRVYQACLAALRQIGVPPSRETEELYKSLIN